MLGGWSYHGRGLGPEWRFPSGPFARHRAIEHTLCV